MPGPKIDLLVLQLEKAQRETVAAANKVSEATRLRQLQAGKATPLWLLGHLANTINTLVLRFTLSQESILTREQARLFSPDFAAGTPPTSDAAMYPTWDEVLGLYNQAMTQAIEGLRSLSDEDLPAPLPGRMPEPLRAYFSSIEVTLVQMIAHDAYHRGQIGLLAALHVD